jgi:hypothetical protein
MKRAASIVARLLGTLPVFSTGLLASAASNAPGQLDFPRFTWTNPAGRTPDHPARPDRSCRAGGAPGSLKPGIDQAAPYSGIVVVPQAHLDDRFIIRATGPESSMPILRPQIRLLPWEPATK